MAVELTQSFSRGPAHLRMAHRRLYDWERDFPLAQQERHPQGMTRLQLRFRLDEAETLEFLADIHSKLNGELPLALEISRTDVRFSILKQGRGGPALSRKVQPIAAFMGRRMSLVYIPAVRTAESAHTAVTNLVQMELAKLEQDPAYLQALQQIATLQRPLLTQVADKITQTLREFLPQVSSVELRLSDDNRSRAFRNAFEILVDDGVLTPLSTKGDGIKSLAALSLIKGTEKPVGLAVLALEEWNSPGSPDTTLSPHEFVRTPLD
jgi:putative ATP-dependent endonuclease of OLD family